MYVSPTKDNMPTRIASNQELAHSLYNSVFNMLKSRGLSVQKLSPVGSFEASMPGILYVRLFVFVDPNEKNPVGISCTVHAEHELSSYFKGFEASDFLEFESSFEDACNRVHKMWYSETSSKIRAKIEKAELELVELGKMSDRMKGIYR